MDSPLFSSHLWRLTAPEVAFKSPEVLGPRVTGIFSPEVSASGLILDYEPVTSEWIVVRPSQYCGHGVS